MLLKLYHLFCALCFLLIIPSGCEITPVPSTNNTGQTPAVCADGNAAFKTIQAAIDASLSGSVIDVCPGTYTENLLIENKNITLRAQEGKSSTIIEAATEASTIRVLGTDDPGVIIEGFTIRGGNNALGLGGGVLCRESTITLTDNAIMNNSALNGGGIGAKDCSVEIKNNQIFSNTAQSRGGGTFISTSQGTVEQNEIFDNTAQEGGGVAVVSAGFRTIIGAMMEMTAEMGQNMQDAMEALSNLAAQFFNPAQQENGGPAAQQANQQTPVLTEPSKQSYEPDSLMVKNNTIRNNNASPPRTIMYNGKESGGGGVWLAGDSPLIENIIRDNRSSINGAGIYVLNSRGRILGNEIHGNVTFEDGAGVLMSMCAGRFADNIVTENRSIDDAGGLRIYFGLNMLIENNIFSKNTARDASGGVKLSHSSNRFINNTLENNQADTGGALDLDNDASTIISCTFKNNQARLGAAIHSKFATAPVLIQDTVFEGNIAEAYGGAIHFEDNAYAVTLTGIEAHNNQALKGGVIATNNSNLDISDSTFNENSADEAGGALFLSGYEELLQGEAESVSINVTTNEEQPKLIKLRRVRMEGNSAPAGGAIFATQHTLFDAANLIVVNNTATETGGGMSLITPHGLLAASIIKSNTAPIAAGLLLSESDRLEIRSCIITDNLTGEGIVATDTPAAVYHSDVYNNQGGDYAGMPSATGSNGNISQDPGFINAEGPDYRLKADSPCVDTGDPNIELRDLDKTRSDMGAYAGPDGTWANTGTAEETGQEIDQDTDQDTTDQDTDQDTTDQDTDQDTEEDTDEDTDDPKDELVIINPNIESNQDQIFLSVADKLQWPAGGHELIVRAETVDGLPWEDGAATLTIAADQSDIELPYSAAAHPMAPGITLIAVQPENKGDVNAYQAAVQSFIKSRPQDERIALYGWGNDFIQITDFTTNRNRLYNQLTRLNRVFAGENAVNPQDVLIEALDIVKNIGKGNQQGMRSVVLICGNAPIEKIPNTLSGATVQWVLPQLAANSLSEGRVVSFRSASDLSDALSQVSERLNQAAAKAFYKIGVCSNPAEKINANISGGSDFAASVKLKKSFDGELGGSCDPETIVAGQRGGVHTVSFFLSEEELAVYQERLDAVEALHTKYGLPSLIGKAMYLSGTARNGFEGAKDRFDISISLDPSQEPVRATAKFRGQNALFSDRKSYTVNIDGKDQRFFGDGAGSDELYLIAMSQDPALFHAYFADTIYSEYDLFPLRFRYVELKLNDETQGVYLMLEKREEELLKDTARLRGVIRRKYEFISPEVEYAVEDDAATRAAYNATLARGVNDAELPAYLHERMDVTQYLYWMGINSILEIADTLDECLFISTESIDGTGMPTDYFRLMGWDPEDMQGACEVGDLYPNDYDLTFCQEAAIERRIINHPQLFADYVDVMNVLVSEMTPERYQALIEKIKAQLFPLLERDGVTQAMQLTDITDAEAAKAMISQRMTESIQKFESRIDVLEAGLKQYEEDMK